jgi:outer membrane protein OmpA-like peptidoglycan-associated protein
MLTAAALLLPLHSCAQKPLPEPVPVDVPTPPERAVPGSNRTLVTEFTRRGIEAREEHEGVVIYLPTVYLFEFDKSTVEPDARRQLREIADVLNEPSLGGRRIIVEGHADAIGSDSYNLALSDRRANAVITQLIASGVDRARLTKRAFGKDRPLEPNKRPDGSDNPEGRARNRRVALIVENPTP